MVHEGMQIVFCDQQYLSSENTPNGYRCGSSTGVPFQPSVCTRVRPRLVKVTSGSTLSCDSRGVPLE